MEALLVLLLLTLIILIPVSFIRTLVQAQRLRNLSEELEHLLCRLDGIEANLRELQTQRPPVESSAAAPDATVAKPKAPAVVEKTAQQPTEAEPAKPLAKESVPPMVAAPVTQPQMGLESAPPPVLAKAIPSLATEPSQGTTPLPAHGETPAAAPEQPPAAPMFNWEQFMGVKLFAWVGGLALFLGVAFFIKYSFERDLVSPELRVALGFMAGLGLIIGGIFLRRKEYAVTSQTLCATGVVILYATTFACRSIYHFNFFGPAATFLLMALITLAAFLLAIRLDAQVVGILGLLGGFLTPMLLSTGQDNPVGLFTYVALLDLGLVAIALYRRWSYQVLLAVGGTVLMQFGWTMRFFTAAKINTALVIYLGFALLFLLAWEIARRKEQSRPWFDWASMIATASAVLFAFFLIEQNSIAQRPGLLFSFLFLADLCWLALAWRDDRLFPIQAAAGGLCFLVLAVWTNTQLTTALLDWALAAYLVFAGLHSAFPIVLQQLRPNARPVWWAHLFPVVALLLVMIPLFRLTELTWLLWPAILLIDALAVVVAALTGALLTLLGVLVLSLGVIAAWLVRTPVLLIGFPEIWIVIGGVAVFFFAAGLWLSHRLLASSSQREGKLKVADWELNWLGSASPETLRAQIPAFSTILPFLLLIMVVVRMDLSNPSPIFGLALLLTVLLLGLAYWLRLDLLPAVGLVCVLALQYVWHQRSFHPAAVSVPLIPLAWHVGFYGLFTIYPFVFHRQFYGLKSTWIAAAMSGPAHFYLVHHSLKLAYPNDFMGLLPAGFAIPSILALVVLLRQYPKESPSRMALLAWFGGTALFFITLIIPIQFSRQWITIGWALEGAALLWLFHRVPHWGLRWVGLGLLVISFVRLTLNPAVLSYHARASTPILNWYLYAYGIVIVCLFAGARLLREPPFLVQGINPASILDGMGIVLAFLLLNIEIADYFTNVGTASLTFDFTGNFTRDMTYSIAWALFALGLLVAGLWTQKRAARYTAIGLLCITLLKLFLHDLAKLDQLHKIGAFIGVAIIAISASVLYQRFLIKPQK